MASNTTDNQNNNQQKSNSGQEFDMENIKIKFCSAL